MLAGNILLQSIGVGGHTSNSDNTIARWNFPAAPTVDQAVFMTPGEVCRSNNTDGSTLNLPSPSPRTAPTTDFELTARAVLFCNAAQWLAPRCAIKNGNHRRNTYGSCLGLRSSALAPLENSRGDAGSS